MFLREESGADGCVLWLLGSGGWLCGKETKGDTPRKPFYFLPLGLCLASPPPPTISQLTALLLGKDGPLLEVPPACFQIPGGLCISCLATGKED